MEKVYGFEPVPAELTAEEAKYIVGGEGAAWTEYMQTPKMVEYMVFPRAIALSEALWTEPKNRSFADFSSRLAAHFARLDKQTVNYRIPEPAGLRDVYVGFLLDQSKNSGFVALHGRIGHGSVRGIQHREINRGHQHHCTGCHCISDAHRRSLLLSL